MATMSSVDAGSVLIAERSKGMAATTVVNIASAAGGALAKETHPSDLWAFHRPKLHVLLGAGTELSRADERDWMHALFDVTDAIQSGLPTGELFSAISERLRQVLNHVSGSLSLLDKASGKLHIAGVDSPRGRELRIDEKDISFSPEGLPNAEAMSSGKPVVTCGPDFQRFASPLYRKYAYLFSGPGCWTPLVGRYGSFGTMAMNREEPFTDDEVDLLVHVSRQLALAMENSIVCGELAEVKDRLTTETLCLEEETDQNVSGMVGESPAFQEVLRNIRVVAPTDATVLVQGETGTGKELIAQALHDLSERSKQPFIKVNCAAIPATLLESELFGHEKGSFTGAFAQKIGRFEMAHKGTLFLDEIGEMPLELQPKILRAIQEQELERVGGNRTIHVDIRLIAATNRNLKQMVEEGKFRSDLYYRLHVFPLNVPPLRERREDIPLLTRYFVQKHSQRMGRNIETIPTSALEALTRYDWPGNIRELQNVLERAVILTHGTSLHIGTSEFAAKADSLYVRHSEASQTSERDRIIKALEEANGQVGGPSGAAARLGLKRTTLQNRMRKYMIARQYR
jgi:formate hydrogenlyase transcriptional activator